MSTRAVGSCVEHHARHLDAGVVGQLQVEDDDLRRRRGEPRDRLASVGRHGHHVVPGRLQVALDRIAPHRVVIDHHHSHHVAPPPQRCVDPRPPPARREVATTSVHQRVAVIAHGHVPQHTRDQARPARPRRPTRPRASPRSSACASRGPWSVGPSRPAARALPGPGAVPAKTSASPRSSQSSSCRTPRPVASSTSVRSASGSSSASTRPGSPPATIHDETVSPARSILGAGRPQRDRAARPAAESAYGIAVALWLEERVGGVDGHDSSRSAMSLFVSPFRGLADP